jgi:hypothetical protein
LLPNQINESRVISFQFSIFDAGKRSATGTRELRAAKSLSFIPAASSLRTLPSRPRAWLAVYRRARYAAGGGGFGGLGGGGFRWLWRQHRATSSHSITSSARYCKNHGNSIPSAFAVFRLMTNSYLAGACTGNSEGFSPLRIRGGVDHWHDAHADRQGWRAPSCVPVGDDHRARRARRQAKRGKREN